MKFLKDYSPALFAVIVLLLFLTSITAEFFQKDKPHRMRDPYAVRIYTVSFNKPTNTIQIIPSNGSETCSLSATHSDLNTETEYSVFECSL